MLCGTVRGKIRYSALATRFRFTQGEQFVQLRLLLVGCVQTPITVRGSSRLTAVQFTFLPGGRSTGGAGYSQDELGDALGIHLHIIRQL
jgi:hypothetical protein